MGQAAWEGPGACVLSADPGGQVWKGPGRLPRAHAPVPDSYNEAQPAGAPLTSHASLFSPAGTATSLRSPSDAASHSEGPRGRAQLRLSPHPRRAPATTWSEEACGAMGRKAVTPSSPSYKPFNPVGKTGCWGGLRGQPRGTLIAPLGGGGLLCVCVCVCTWEQASVRVHLLCSPGPRVSAWATSGDSMHLLLCVCCLTVCARDAGLAAFLPTPTLQIQSGGEGGPMGPSTPCTASPPHRSQLPSASLSCFLHFLAPRAASTSPPGSLPGRALVYPWGCWVPRGPLRLPGLLALSRSQHPSAWCPVSPAPGGDRWPRLSEPSRREEVLTEQRPPCEPCPHAGCPRSSP